MDTKNYILLDTLDIYAVHLYSNIYKKFFCLQDNTDSTPSLHCVDTNCSDDVFDLMLGFSQGVRRSVGGLATILGPLWAGGLTENMYIMLGVIMALLLLLTVHI